jgi:hypothetical protein
VASPFTDEAARRIAENESRFRAANEKIEDAVLQFDPDPVTVPFVCECGRPECLQTVRLSILEYEAVRANGAWFLCVPGHQIISGGIGRLEREALTYVVVEKIGAAGAVADELDPRAEEELTG